MMNNLIRLPEIGQTMMALQREMVKAGVIEELVDDAMGQDDEELEEEAEEEVEKVLAEITSDLFQGAGAVPLQRVSARGAARKRLPPRARPRLTRARAARPRAAQVAASEAPQRAQPSAEEEEEQDDSEVLAMQARLDSLKAS